MTLARTLLRRLSGERGYSLIELLTTMSILGTVLAVLTGVFISGARAQVDLSDRVQAQNNAVIALSKLRRDVNCAVSAVVPGNGVSATLTTPCGGTVTWCTTLTSANRYALRRRVGPTCGATDVLVADYLRSSAVFDYQNSAATGLRRKQLRAMLETRTPKMQSSYRLCDLLVLRNSDPPTGGDAVTPC